MSIRKQPRQHMCQSAANRKAAPHDTIPLAANLRLLRYVHGFSQEYVCTRLNISRSAYRAMESGSRLPDVIALHTVSALYGVDIDVLLTFDIAGLLASLSDRDAHRKNAPAAICETLSANLRRLRISRGLSQQYIAAKLFISRSAYSAYETGQRLPDLRMLTAIADLYGISPGALLEHDPTAQRPQTF